MQSKLIALLALTAALAAPLFAWASPNIVYVTRHAEKAAVDQDPDLTAQGAARARTVAAMLRKAGIRAIFSTPTKRTQQTAAPLAALTGLEVQAYDAAKPALVVEKIKGMPGPTLLVGHSNTIGELVKLLGGAPGTPIGDDEYDRLYQLSIADDGTVTTVMLSSVVAPVNP
jgi:phosphohistidine phosphatase SixA